MSAEREKQRPLTSIITLRENVSRLCQLILFLLSALIAEPSGTAASEVVWRWFVACDHPSTMTLEVRFERTLLYRSSFSICRVDRAEVERQDSRVLKFAFKPPHRLVWTGYRETNNTTDPGQELEGNIWEAGGEQDALLLGVSFMTAQDIMMNTLHVAPVERESTTEIVEGLSVTTRPAKTTRNARE